MKSLVIKRSIAIAGRKTSVSLEDTFWNIFKEIADQRHTTISELAGEIDLARRHNNLSSAIWVFVLAYYRNLVSEHEKRDKMREVLAVAPLQNVSTQ